MILRGLSELASLFQDIYTKPIYLCWHQGVVMLSGSFETQIEMGVTVI